MRSRRNVVIVVVFIIGITIAAGVYAFLFSPTEPKVESVPPPSEPPGYSIQPIEVGFLVINASVDQFFAFIPHRGGLSLSFTLELNVSNSGGSDITDFHLVRSTVYNQTFSEIWSFDLTDQSNATIESGMLSRLTYDVSSHSLPRGTVGFNDGDLFSRVLVAFNDSEEAVLTTPLAPLLIAIE